MDMTLIGILAVLFLGELVRSSIGFGNALVSMPLLVLLVDLQTATPLFALVSFIVGFAILVSSWRSVRLRDAWRLNLGALAGIPVGLWMLNTVPNAIGVGILGVLIVLYGLYNLFGPQLPEIDNDNLAFPVGAIGGLTNAAFNVAGPPIVIYGALRRWDPVRFRATIQAFFIPTGIFVIAGHGLSGLWTGEVIRLALYSVPVALVAMFIGNALNQRIPQDKFRYIIDGFLVVIGVFMLVRL